MDQHMKGFVGAFARTTFGRRHPSPVRVLGKICKGFAVAGAALAAHVSWAGPFVFEETVKIPSPDPTYSFPLDIAVEGDTIIATGRKFDSEGLEVHTAFLFQRQSNGGWSFVRPLASGGCDSGEVAEDTCTGSVAIRNGVATVVVGDVHVYVRQQDGAWTESPSDGTAGPGHAAMGTNTVVASESVGCYFATRAFRKNSSGVWSLVATLPGISYPGCDHWGMAGVHVDVSAGNRIIVGTDDGEPVRVYEPSGSGWGTPIELLPRLDPYRFGRVVAIDDNRAFVSGTYEAAVHAYNRTSGAWSYTTDLVMPDGDRLGAGAPAVDDFVFVGFAGDPYRGGSVSMFKEVTPGDYRQVARLVRSDSLARATTNLGNFDGWTSGSFARVVAGDAGPGGGLYVYDVNQSGTTPTPRQYDFEVNAAEWTPIAGSSFAVVPSGPSRVYRQSATTGDAGSYVTTLDWKNQAIETDIKLTGFNGSDRWAGLALRRTDASNYYYTTLRQSNVLDIKRRVNGASVTLASVPQQVVLNRSYRLRFEAVGTLLRVYLNGALAVQVRDTTLTHGSPGLQMYRAQADYDNVVLTQNPHLTLLDLNGTYYRSFADRFVSGPGVWNEDFSTGKQVIHQTSTAGDARAPNRIPTGDQIVQVRIAPTQFAAGTGSRWFGLMARYVDASNYYYVTLRSDNTISLRKLVNGAIQTLDSAPLAVSPGTAYVVRLEAVGTKLRAYVNGTFLLEANDSSHPRGAYGPVMYKTAASYQDLLVWQP